MKRDLTRSLLYFSPRTVLLLTILLAPLSFMAFKSVTFDEVSHLPAGYSYWKTWSIRYNQQHPPLIKELCALPLLLLGIQGPDSLPENEWVYGRQFLFGDSVDANDAVFWGRLPVILLSVALACLTMIWSESLWGRSAGLLALCLYGFDPTITAHSQVVTTDVGVAFFATHYLFQLRAYLKNPSNLRLIVASVALGLALGAKFSAVVLLPISVCLLFIDLRYLPKATEHTPGSLRSLGKKVNWSKLVLQLVFRMTLISVIASAVVWLLYFCPLDPWFYLKGIRSVHQDHPSNSYYYLMGTLQPGNRKYYLLIAWLIKTPLPSLILLTIAIGLFFRGRRAEPLEEAFLLLPLIGFMAFYSFLGDNIGVRYLIPCFPFLFIFASRIFSNAIRSERVPRLLVADYCSACCRVISISPPPLLFQSNRWRS